MNQPHPRVASVTVTGCASCCCLTLISRLSLGTYPGGYLMLCSTSHSTLFSRGGVGMMLTLRGSVTMLICALLVPY